MGKFLIKKTATGIVFHLVAANGETIGTSQVYASEEGCKKGIESVMHNAPKSEIEDQTAGESKLHPKFEIYKDAASEFRFRLMATNGQEILASEGYTTKENCKKGIESVIHNAPEAPIVEPEA